jgi:hypothetical protein
MTKFRFGKLSTSFLSMVRLIAIASFGAAPGPARSGLMREQPCQSTLQTGCAATEARALPYKSLSQSKKLVEPGGVEPPDLLNAIGLF